MAQTEGFIKRQRENSKYASFIVDKHQYAENADGVNGFTKLNSFFLIPVNYK
jgi:hypothetical protein